MSLIHFFRLLDSHGLQYHDALKLICSSSTSTHWFLISVVGKDGNVINFAESQYQCEWYPSTDLPKRRVDTVDGESYFQGQGNMKLQLIPAYTAP